MAEDDSKNVVTEMLAGGMKIKGEDIDFIIVVKKGHGKDYPMPAKKSEGDETAAAQATTEDATKPPETEGDAAAKKPEETSDLSSEVLADLEEVKGIKVILINKVLQAELKDKADLDIETRKAELVKLKLNDLTKLLPKSPDEKGEGYSTDMTLSQGASNKKEIKGLRDLIELGLDEGVL